jgi:hypothetical protein
VNLLRGELHQTVKIQIKKGKTNIEKKGIPAIDGNVSRENMWKEEDDNYLMRIFNI